MTPSEPPTGSDAGRELGDRLTSARSDPRRLAAELPQRAGGSGAELVVILLFCLGCLVAALVMAFVLAGPLAGLLTDLGAVLVYLVVRWVVKPMGLLSIGAFTVTPDGVVRAITGISKARRRARQGRFTIKIWAEFAQGALIGVLLVVVPTAVAVGLDRPEVLLGWMVFAMLALNEMALMGIRIQADLRRRGAEAFESEFGLALASDYLARGGDEQKLKSGIGLMELAPSSEGDFATVMAEAFLRWQPGSTGRT